MRKKRARTRTPVSEVRERSPAMKAWLFAGLGLVSFCLCPSIRGAEKPLSKSQQKKFVASAIKFLAYKRAPGGAEKRREILEELKTYENFSWKGLRKAFRPPTAKPFLRPPKKKSNTTLQFPLPGLENCRYILDLPRGYTPSRPWPLAFLLHGGGMNEGNGSQIHGLLGPPYKKRGCIVVAPTCPPDQFWSGPLTESFILSILEETAAAYSVDFDRLYVAGHSYGGTGSWSFGPRFPDLFAGFGPAAGTPQIVMDWDLLHNTAFYVVHGLNDPRVDPKDALEAQKKVEALPIKPRNYKFDFFQGGHEFPNKQIEAMAEFLTRQKRDMFPKRAVCAVPFVQVREGVRTEYHTFWLGVDESPFKGKAVGELAGDNLIRIRTESVNRVSVFVSDDFLDLDKPVVIEMNGAKVFEKKVERSAKFLLEHMEATGDRGRVFAARIRLNP